MNLGGKGTGIHSAGGPRPVPAVSSLISGLLHYWTMDTTGVRVDAVGTADFTDPTATPTAPGIINDSADLELSTPNRLVQIDPLTISPSANPFTVSLWVNFETVGGPGTIQIVIGKWDISGNQREWYLAFEGTPNRILFRYSPDGISQFNVPADALGAPTPGTWYHVLAWWDGATSSIRVNGGAINSNPFVGPVFHSAIALGTIGAAQNGGSWILPLDGRVDEVGYWNRVLTPTEQDTLYNGGAPEPFPWTP